MGKLESLYCNNRIYSMVFTPNSVNRQLKMNGPYFISAYYTVFKMKQGGRKGIARVKRSGSPNESSLKSKSSHTATYYMVVTNNMWIIIDL